MKNFSVQRVFAAELARINKRKSLPVENPEDAIPNTKLGLTGLAFSGGGIRSATLNLGILQALEKRKILSHIDYLSTVSGGGYIGSCLSASLSRNSNFPFKTSSNGDESLALKHLRTYGNFLASGGLRDYLRIPALLLRGWLINLLVILPYILFLVVFTVILSGDSILHALQRHAAAQVTITLPQDSTVKSIPVNLGTALRSSLPLNSRYARILKYRSANFARTPRCNADGDNANFHVITTRSLILSGLPEGAKPIQSKFNQIFEVPGTSQTWVVSQLDAWKSPPKPETASGCITQEIPLSDSAEYSELNLNLMTDTRTPENFTFDVLACDNCVEGNVVSSKQVIKRIESTENEGGLSTQSFVFTRILILLFLLVIISYPIVQAIMGSRSSLQVRDKWTKRLGGCLLLIGGAAIVESQPLAIYQFSIWSGVLQDTPLLGKSNAGDLLSGSILALAGFLATFAQRISAANEGFARNLGIIVLGALAPVALWLLYLTLSHRAILPYWQGLEFFGLEKVTYQVLTFMHDKGLNDSLTSFQTGTSEIVTIYLVIAIALFMFSMFFVDVNRTSLHRFYRDRLGEAYLSDPSVHNKVKKNMEDSISLQEIDSEAAPYHLINCAMNLPPSRSIDDHGRGAVPFMFSPEFVGSERTGYCRTSLISQIDPHIDLGTAMAISGAAASPRMGSATIKPLAFILAMLNVRLGYWCPNPRYLFDDRQAKSLSARIKRLWARPGPVKLLKEMLGSISEKDQYVNVSDGGHIENLAVYELLRRRCAFIIACDAEADPDLTFDGLANLIRQARIDFGITIEINVDDIRWDKSQVPATSHQNYAVGRIIYPDDDCPPGLLLYLKSSVLGTESEDISKYRADNPDFPHESTADQFFNEAQFESYRALGFNIGSGQFEIGQESYSHETASVRELLLALNCNLEDS